MKQLLSSLAEYHDIQFNEAQLWQKSWRFSRNDTFQAHAGNFPGNTNFVEISINRNVNSTCVIIIVIVKHIAIIIIATDISLSFIIIVIVVVVINKKENMAHMREQ